MKIREESLLESFLYVVLVLCTLGMAEAVRILITRAIKKAFEE